jgi:hypothetical protein
MMMDWNNGEHRQKNGKRPGAGKARDDGRNVDPTGVVVYTRLGDTAKYAAHSRTPDGGRFCSGICNIRGFNMFLGYPRHTTQQDRQT